MTEPNRNPKATHEGLVVEGLDLVSGGTRVRATFRVGANQCQLLVAPSGSGKSTVLKTIAGIPTGFERRGGSITLNGVSLDSVPMHRREVGFVMQELHLFSDLTVLENAAFALKVRQVSDSEQSERAEYWLKRAGLGEHLTASVDTLSGGERQRLALVRALIARPRLMLLDEPFSALDTDNRVRCLEIVAELWAENPCPCVMVTHDAAFFSDLPLGPTAQKFLHRSGDSAGLLIDRHFKTR